MAYRHFLILLLVIADCLSFNQSRRVIVDHEDQLGYIAKAVKQESDNEKSTHSDVALEERNFEFTNERLPKVDLTGKVTVASLDPRQRSIEEFSFERVKNDSALPLHVTSTARQECLEGYVADENGICQKTIAGKGKKSFKLRRRKRGEQIQPKLSYADVVKFGKNRPLTVPFKAEILTTTPGSMMVKTDGSSIITTIKPIPSEAVGLTTPIAFPRQAMETATTLPPISHGVASTTLAPNIQKKVSETSITTPSNVTPKEALGKASESIATTLSTTVKELTTTVNEASVTPVKKPEVTTIPPPGKPTNAVPTRPFGYIVPTIITGIPNRVKSILGDINNAFLSGEKQSISAQNSDGSYSMTLSGKKKITGNHQIKTRELK